MLKLRYTLSLLVLFICQISWLQEIGEETNPFPMDKVDHSETLWYAEMKTEHPNVLQAEVYFNAYFTAHYKETSHQKRAFLRWLEQAKLSIDSEGFYLPFEPNYDAMSFGTTVTTKTFGSWQMLGPNFAEETTCGTSSSLSGGFCDRVYINPYNTNNLFAGFSYGGLWVSQDQGATWSLTDAEFGNGTNTYANRDYYYGEIEASSIDNNLVYAATESGLLKSTNGGEGWLMCAELNRNIDPTKRPYFIALSSADENILLSTFGRKLFRSTDGGDSWTEAFDNTSGGSDHYYGGVHVINNEFGIYARPSNFFGLEKDMDEDNVFYLGAFNAANDPCIYKSTDAGVSFSLLVNLNSDLGRTLPNNMAFQTIPDNPDQLYIYSLFTNDTIYRYSEAGILNTKNYFGKTEGVRVNPLNENNVYTGYYFASSINKSIDGGNSYVDMTSGYGGCPKYVHPDVRYIDVVGDLVFIGTDGGLAISTDAMETVETIGREISAIDLWGFSSSPKSDILSAGCDHGPTKIRRYNGDNGWISRGGGDASRTSVNQANDKMIYYNHGYGKFKTKLDVDGVSFLYTQSLSTSMRLNTLEFHPNLFNTFYGHSGSKIYRTRDNLDTETEFADFGTTVNEFKIAPQDSTKMYVLHGNNTVKRSTNAGLTWTDITPSIIISEGYTNIIGLTVGNNPNELWLAYGNYQNEAKILHSSSGGLIWDNLTTATLPLTPVSAIVHQLGTNGGVYLAFSGNAGVWYKSNDLPDWVLVGTGLPTIGYIRDVFTVTPKGKLRMGSSRGSWEHDLIEESTVPIANFSASSKNVYCPVTPIEFIQNAVHSSGEAVYHWDFPGGYPSESAEQNPVVYYATPGMYDVSLTVTDEFGTSDTKTMANFINMLDNSCPDTDGDGIDDFDETASCTNLLDESVYISPTDSILITNFDGGTGSFYISIELGNKCDTSYAEAKFSVDLETNKINPWSYQHFGSDLFIDPLTESDAAQMQTSVSHTPAKIAFKLIDDQLYLHHLTNECDTGEVKLIGGCWSSIDADGDGIPNSEDLDSDNDGIPDYTENTPCYELVNFNEILVDFDSTIVHIFESGISFISLSIQENCTDKMAYFDAHIDTDLNKISVINYQHFNAIDNNYTYDFANRVTSVSDAISQLRFELIGDVLYLIQLSSDCISGVTVSPFCWSSIDYDKDGVANYLDLDSDADGLTDAEETTYCYDETPYSDWFSSGDSTLVVDFATIPSDIDQYYVSLNAYTNCYGLTATLNAVVDVDKQKINASYFNHYSDNNSILGNGTNQIESQSGSFAKPKFSLVGSELYLVQISNACGSVMRLNPSCITPLDTICETGHPNYLYSGNFNYVNHLCAGDTLIFGAIEITESGEYTQEFTSTNGCDSTVTLMVDLYPEYASEITAEICKGDTLLFGELSLTETGEYSQTFSTVLGCDSVVTLSLSVYEINTSLTLSGWTISAEEMDETTYLWVDCNADFAPVVPTEDNANYTVSESGSYAVIIAQNGCVDTSDCVILDDAYLNENSSNTIGIHPNPTIDVFTISLNHLSDFIHVEITDLTGRRIYKNTFYNTSEITIDVNHFANGEYILITNAQGEINTFRIIKQ